MLRIAWRLQRGGLIGMTAFGTFFGLLQTAAYNSIAGTTPASRAAFGEQMAVLGTTLTYLLPLPVHLETVGGYLEWRVFGVLPLLFAFWAVLSASGAGRGDEDRGLVEMWLGAGLGRLRYVACRVAIFAIVALIAIAITTAVIDLGAVPAGGLLDTVALVEIVAALLALTLCCYAFVLVVSQLAPSRALGAGAAGALLAVAFFVNSLSRTVDGLRPLASVISPFYYLDRTIPLAPGGSSGIFSSLGMLVVALALAGAAAWFMRVRDLGSALLRRRPHSGPFVTVPSANPLLRVPVASALYEQRAALLAWTVGAAVAAAVMAPFARAVVDDVVERSGVPGFRALALVLHGDPYVAFTGYFWFAIFQLLLAVFAILQVARWSADDQEGRLEMELSAPVSRLRVVGERAAALLVATAVVVACSSAALLVSSRAANVGIRPGDLFTASWPLLPFALSFAAVGAVLAARVPRATVGALMALAFASYLVTLAGPLMRWPDWVLRLSVFSLYGSPLVNGVYWTGLWTLLGVAIAGFGLGAIMLQRREVGA